MKALITPLPALLLSGSVASCAATAPASLDSAATDWAPIPLGGAATDLRLFVATDCTDLHTRFADCSATDPEGRRYTFFDGVLSKIAASKSDAAGSLLLPAGLQFGEEIEFAAAKVSRTFGVRLDRGTTFDGRIVYSSDFVIPSSAGRRFSIELIADVDGRLHEFVERTDF